MIRKNIELGKTGGGQTKIKYNKEKYTVERLYPTTSYSGMG